MLELKNKTPYAAGIVPGLDRDGRDLLTVVVKGTFTIPLRGREVVVAAEQADIVHADVFFGDAGASSVRYESEACPAKPGTDVVLVGHAFSPRPVESMDVSLAAGPLRKTVRVTGDRAWYRAAGGGMAASSPLPFSRMPLVYERAFGGVDVRSEDESEHGREARNPLGTGYCKSLADEHVAGVRLPNLEDPRALITVPADKPPPAGFGFVARDAMPRVGYAGTYDETWQSERCPFLPADFDERYFHGAPAELCSPRHFRGGEAVVATGVSELGDIAFEVPRAALTVALRRKGETTEHAPVLDTIVIEASERRVLCTWKVTVPLRRGLLYVDWVKVRETA